MPATPLAQLQSQADDGFGRIQNALEEGKASAALLPALPHVEKETIEAYRRAGLTNQLLDLTFRVRCRQVEQLGFPRIDPSAVAASLVGGWSSDRKTVREVRRELAKEARLEYYHDTQTGKEFRPSHPGGHKKMTQVRYYGVARRTGWFAGSMAGWWEGRREHKHWSVLLAPMDTLKSPIPFGVVLRVEEIRKAKVFSHFAVLAPEEMFRGQVPDDPVVVGVVARGLKESNTAYVDEECALFAVARWGDVPGGEAAKGA